MQSAYLGLLTKFLNYISRYFLVNMTYKVKLSMEKLAHRDRGGPGN